MASNNNLFNRFFSKLVKSPAKVSNHYIEYSPETIKHYKKENPHIEFSEIEIPPLNLGEHFKISKWLKSDGDRIQKGDILCDIESDTFSLEFESSIEGFIYFRQKPGVLLAPGKTICIIIHQKTTPNVPIN
ncbi:lipoyl domain-containing protein [bacterium SCSIO 12643]|nr:lipoyl domain-containing protein [bacterium SCSIO 12643]